MASDGAAEQGDLQDNRQELGVTESGMEDRDHAAKGAPEPDTAPVESTEHGASADVTSSAVAVPSTPTPHSPAPDIQSPINTPTPDAPALIDTPASGAPVAIDAPAPIDTPVPGTPGVDTSSPAAAEPSDIPAPSTPETEEALEVKAALSKITESPPEEDAIPEEEETDVQADEGDLSEEQDTSPHATTSILEEEEEGVEEEEEGVEEEGVGAEEEEEEALPTEEDVHAELLERCRSLLMEREKILLQNGQHQQKLYYYFRRKKAEETARRAPVLVLQKPVADQEHRYIRYLSMLGELRHQYAQDSEFYNEQMEEMRAQCQEKVDKVNEEWRLFQRQKREVALSVLTGKKGRHVASKDLEELQAKEQQKEDALIQVRLENIKLKNKINRFEVALKAKEELADGLHLIDFEQLKIENQNFNEKIEERNEELLKLRKKITGTVQVLSHLKEKLQFVQAENQVKKEQLMETEALVAQKRDVLTKTKQARDSLRISNVKLQNKCGLLGNEMLLRDFEGNVDATEELGQKLENLKRRHAELILTSNGLRKKIEVTKSSV
ncbi:hypothetical protein NDU88_001639 [Pleurodeles waltl]|uniref:CCDC113/CCDC96 coiled-coil domain-containing protein n=1 Tax=Pleurodeles waltl TaxID=8319 RepID=A0AAV7WM46_PLEWA|nr:hypothetical protein NDU88_001639 [Pleurodeles waltl]